MIDSNDETSVPGVLLPGVTVPTNWEYAYGYPEGRRAMGFRYLAVWWDVHSDDVTYSDGRTSATAEWIVFQELVALVDQAGLGVVRWGLGLADLSATHVLLLDLVERTVRATPLREALAWLRREAPPAPALDLPGVDSVEGIEGLIDTVQQGIDEFVEVEHVRWERTMLCPVCLGLRWRRAACWPENGYVACDVCDDGLVADDAPVAVAAEQAIREQLDMFCRIREPMEEVDDDTERVRPGGDPEGDRASVGHDA